MDLVDWDQDGLRRDHGRPRGLRPPSSRCPSCTGSRSPRSTATTWSTARTPRRGTTGRRCSSTSRRSTSPPTARYSTRRGCRCSGSSARTTTRTTTTAATPARSSPARCSVGDEVVVLPDGRESRRSPGSTRSTAPSRRRSRRCRSPRCSRTTSTSRAATCCAPPTRPAQVARDLHADVCWLGEQPARPSGRYLDQAHDADHARRADADRAPGRRRQPAHRARPGRPRAQRHRPRRAPHGRAARRRPLRRQPRHRQLHPDRRGDERHRRRRHGRRARCATAARAARTSCGSAARRTREDRWAALGQPGATIWLTGLPSSGKSAIAAALEAKLVGAGTAAYLIDGDNLRHGLSGDLGFDAGSRAENVRRAGEAARMLADAGLVVARRARLPVRRAPRRACAAATARRTSPFVEVYVDTPLEVCEQRDPKGLYRRARAGTLHGLTGVDDPYEPPADPDLVLDGTQPIEDGVAALEALLRGARPAVISYLVCATPRSGSTLLCETLPRPGWRATRSSSSRRCRRPGCRAGRSTTCAGLDDDGALALVEDAPPHDAAALLGPARRAATTPSTWTHVRRLGTTPNGVFGAKIMWAHLEDLGRAARAATTSTRSSTTCSTGRGFVWVRREDTVRQAVSLWRAMQTQSWRAENERATRRAAVLVRRAAPPRRAARGPRRRLGALLRRRRSAVLALTLRGGRGRPGRSGRDARSTHIGVDAADGCARRAADDAPPGRRAVGRLGGGATRATRSPPRAPMIAACRPRRACCRASARHGCRARAPVRRRPADRAAAPRSPRSCDSRHGRDPAARPETATSCARAPRRASRRRSSRASAIPVGKGFAGRVAAERRPVSSTDVDHADILNPILREKGIRSLLGVPLLIEGRVIGVLHVGTLDAAHVHRRRHATCSSSPPTAPRWRSSTPTLFEREREARVTAERASDAALEALQRGHRRRARVPARRTSCCTELLDRISEILRQRHRRDPPARAQRRVPARPRRQGHRGGGRAGRPHPRRQGLRRAGSPPSAARSSSRTSTTPTSSTRSCARRASARCSASRCWSRAGSSACCTSARSRRACSPTTTRPAPARRRPRRARDRAGGAVRAAPARRGAPAAAAARAARRRPRRRARQPLPAGQRREPRRRLVRRVHARRPGGSSLVVGDVVGHGLEAAAVMAQLRTALRAYAVDGHAPAAIVERVNRLMWQLGPTAMTTLAYARDRPRRRDRSSSSTPAIRRRS